VLNTDGGVLLADGISGEERQIDPYPLHPTLYTLTPYTITQVSFFPGSWPEGETRPVKLTVTTP
jgi:hypothetical protein